MDEETEISTSIADDKKSQPSDSREDERELKEKSELLFEIQTICNMDSLVSHCELLNHESKLFPAEDFSKDSENNILEDTNMTNSGSESEKFKTETTATDVHHSGTIFILNDETEMSDIPQEPISDSNDNENSREENDSQKSNTDAKMTEENESLELAQKQATCYRECDSFLTKKSCEKYSVEPLADSSDDKRYSRRGNKRRKELDDICPICGVTLRWYDLQSHYNMEVTKLLKMSKYIKKPRLEPPRNEDFDLVRKNRENRLTARVAKYAARASSEVKCPVCSLRMSGTAEEINKHVAFCIQAEDSEVDVDGDDEGAESFEEYEIGDETRIRPISLVPGGYRSLHGNSVRQTHEEEVLNVDIDDTVTYGNPQYSEVDVIPDITNEVDRRELEELRKAVNPTVQPQNIECSKWSKKVTEVEVTELSESKGDSDPVLITSLKEKIKTLEDLDKSVRCLICLEPYTKPVVSITCWHVHCEECWLMTMGVKKLCPQCNMITFPSDLRKIYL